MLGALIKHSTVFVYEVGIVTHAPVEDWPERDPLSPSTENLSGRPSKGINAEKAVPLPRVIVSSKTPRRGPRQSMILVLCDDQVIQPELLVDHVASEEEIDLTIACAGQPGNLDALKRTAGNARFLLAPAGISAEDLRELAMEQTPGDIVTLVDASHLRLSGAREQFVAS